MLEIEMKARVSEPRKVKESLRKLGAKFLKGEVQRDVYFNHPSRDFEKSDEALRIRKVGKKFYLTYKGPKIDALTKTREEHEVEISDFESAKEILNKTGFGETLEVKKYRGTYSYGDFLIMLDRVENLGDFVEVEKKRGSYKPEDLTKLLKKIGVEEKDFERRSYLELLLAKLR